MIAPTTPTGSRTSKRLSQPSILRPAPERILGSALIDTSARPGSRPFDALLAGMMPHIIHPSRRGDKRLIDLCIRMGQAIGPTRFVAHLRAIIDRPDSRSFLPGVSVPATIIVGDQDTVTIPEMAGIIPHAKLVRIPAYGHVPTLEKPDAVNHVLGDWLGAITR